MKKPYLQTIIRAAATLEERLAHLAALKAPASDAMPLVQARLTAWARALNGPAALERFLAWENLDLDEALRALAPIPAATPALQPDNVPPWATFLDDVVSGLEQYAPENARRETLRASPQPFASLLQPFVDLAQERLTARAPAGCDLLAAEARHALGAALLARLVHVAARTFYADFHAARADHLTRHPESPPAEGDHALYDAFIAQTLPNLADYFTRYPVLARQLATLALLWIEAQSAFLQRLDADYAEIERVFGAGAGPDLGRVVALEPALSDPHRGGHRVTGLRFASGRRLIYKPRSLGLARAFNDLLTWLAWLAWLNDHGPDTLPTMRVLEVLDRHTYGWIEAVTPDPCTDGAGVLRFYRRAGVLLALVHALNGTDCHAENLIAAGEFPVLVDYETLLRPVPGCTCPPTCAQAPGSPRCRS